MAHQRSAAFVTERPTLAVCFGLFNRFDPLVSIILLSPVLTALQENFLAQVKNIVGA